MAKLVVEVTEHGLTVPAQTLEQAGLRAGRRVELVPLPGVEEIQHRALGYAIRNLGDAVGVGRPRWGDERWIVELYAPDGRQPLGMLVLDAHGDVISDESATRESVWEALSAASTAVPAAG
jgi:bifunctional DNA-binding transcriptional regulator/antitoxin component of YhaV-PrlF toxin-antitoxin module